MEKEISEFKNTAVVTLRREEKTKFPVEKLLYSGKYDILSNELYLEYNLYVNDEKMDGKYLYLYEGCILESKTLKEITEEDIINFLNEVMEKRFSSQDLLTSNDLQLEIQREIMRDQR